MTIEAGKVGIPRDLILEGPRTKESNQPHGRIGRLVTITTDFSMACVRQNQSDAMDEAKWDAK